jgi:DNA-binding transcriptional LysR family regulator
VQLVLAPMMAPFLTRYPQINIEIIDEPGLIDIVGKGFDAGVRFEEHLAKDMIAVSLGPPQRDVVASPRSSRS